MNDDTFYPSSEALTTFYDGEFTEFFGAAARSESRELILVEFYERRPDLGEIEELKQINWNVRVPEQASVFVATSGLLRDSLGVFWLGWRDEASLSALSLFQESPVTVSMEADDLIIQPPIVVASKKMHQYFWRFRSGAWSLLRHEFTGEFGSPGKAETVLVHRTKSEPILFAAASIPGSERDQTLVAWVSVTDEDTIVNALLLSDDSPVEFASYPIPGIPPLGRQRIGVHVEPNGCFSISFIVKHLSYVLFEFTFDPVDPAEERTKINATPIHVPPDTIYSARIFYHKSTMERDSFLCLLSEEGVLTLMVPDDDYVQVIRQDVDLSYDFPILTSAGGIYEARFNQQGEIELVSLF